MLSATDIEPLKDAAARAAGQARFGLDPFAEYLRALLTALAEEAALSPAGDRVTRKEILSLLRNRLEITGWLAAHPDILDEPIRRPVFLMGLPRSGTTFLQHLFDHDDRFRLLRAWETLRPCPPPATNAASVRARQAEARRFLGRWKTDVVNFDAIHLLDPEGPDECSLLLNIVFAQAGFLNYLDVPGYVQWLLAHADFRAVYRFHRQILQLLQWGAAPRRWLLKYPNHLLAMPEIEAVYPDATLVITHRDPVQTLASLCDLTAQFRAPRHLAIDRHRIGQQMWSFVRSHVDRLMASRARLPRHRMVDVDYYRLVAAPLATVKDVYRSLQMDMPVAVQQKLRQWVQSNPKGSRGSHRYTLESFGLDMDQVNASFASYRDCFRIPVERGAESSP